MSKVKTTVKEQVFKVLNQRLELGGETELNRIQRESELASDKFCFDFRTNYSHLISIPYKDSTVNRYMELWLKKQISK